MIAAQVMECLKANYHEQARLSKRSQEIWFSYLSEKETARATRLLQEWSSTVDSLHVLRREQLEYTQVMFGDLSANQW